MYRAHRVRTKFQQLMALKRKGRKIMGVLIRSVLELDDKAWITSDGEYLSSKSNDFNSGEEFPSVDDEINYRAGLNPVRRRIRKALARRVINFNTLGPCYILDEERLGIWNRFYSTEEKIRERCT